MAALFGPTNGLPIHFVAGSLLILRSQGDKTMSFPEVERHLFVLRR